MLNRMLSLLLALVLLCAPAAFAEDESAALAMDELTEWADSLKARAMAASPMNDPAAPDSSTEDGFAFVYDFATLYMDRPEMTAEAVVRGILVTSPEEEGPRGTRVDYLADEVLDAFYNENDNLAGDENFATLYVSDTMPSGALWGWVQRDGQRVLAIQYAVHEQAATGGDGYTDAGLVYTIQNDYVSAIRAYGLDARIDAAAAQTNLDSVNEVASATGYVRIPVSYTGEMPPMSREDLVFSGIDFLSVTPESAVAALGECREDVWMQDDTGEHLRTMEFEHCTITFVYNADKSAVKPYMLLIDMDGMEGPRAVRIGDSFASIRNRFRHGEGEYDGVSKETLYGTEGSGDWGCAEYGQNADAVLRYAVATDENTAVVLHMAFEVMQLNEVMIYLAD